MTMYIRSAACLSPAFPLEGAIAEARGAVENGSWQTAHGSWQEIQNGPRPMANGQRLTANEPDYNKFVDPKMIRRMSRIVKMGVSAALHCLKTGGDPLPGALITGTAYGCLEDTGIFLRKMIANNEEMLSPTAFIQSTHNTVGAQVALLLKCHSYNNTIVHRAFSLEHSLTEADMLLTEGMGPVLVGAVDEITNDSFALLSRFDRVSRQQAADSRAQAGGSRPETRNGQRPAANGQRFPAGEGAAFFLLQSEPSGNDLARIDHVATLLRPEISASETLAWIREELVRADTDPGSIGIILDGSDDFPGGTTAPAFSGANHIAYKSLCGEFPTAAGFALWLAAVLSGGSGIAAAGKKIILYNRTRDGHHSLILVSSC